MKKREIKFEVVFEENDESEEQQKIRLAKFLVLLNKWKKESV